MNRSNLYAQIPANLPEELFQEILSRSGVDIRIERIVSRGHCSPPGFWYDQSWDEWILVIQGRAVLEMAQRPEGVELGPGDYLLLAAHTRHRVAWTDPGNETIWLAVHILAADALPGPPFSKRI